MTGTDHYAKTAEIRSAVKGRETEVLDRLGVLWRNGKPHIDCPYPDHGGRNDWRWNLKKGRAFCTCIGKRPGEKRSHSIFEVFAVKEGVDFDTAKIRIAEMIGRSDLIKTKGKGNRYQATDAKSLLNPAPDNRDDDLVWKYLGYRLGVDPDLVPRPTTRAAGIKALGYFEPPPLGSKNTSPTLVATMPCAVFEQIDREGNTHAHRIYVAEDGCGKAELGIDANGKPRVSKKSAKIIGEENTSGRSVLWGDPLTATLAVICEGIETASAVALAFQSEIEAGGMLVAGCISAVGIENFKPWLGTKQVIVAADRDEAVAAGGHAPSRRGEQAARQFAIRHYSDLADEAAIQVSIALPGTPGESVDWLDILRRDGIAAVHSGIMGCLPYVPSGDEIERQFERITAAQQAQVVNKTYLLPVISGLRLEYRYTQSGEIWLHRFEEQKGNWVPVTTPMGVPALLELVNQDSEYGLRVLVRDMSGKARVIDFERGELARLGASEIRARLFAAGLRVEGDGENICIRILKAAKPPSIVTVVSRPGWYRLPDPVFVTPGGEVIGAQNGSLIELAGNVRLPERVACSGTLEGWQSAVSAAVTAENCPHWTLSAAAGFCGTLTDLLRLETCGLHVSGYTSLGKTTGQQIAVSAWSSPSQKDQGLFRSMRSTENAVEVLARDSNGTVLALDEMAHADGKAVGRIIYSLAGDVGKARMRSDSSPRRPHTWSTFALLSGEKSLAQKIQDDGGHLSGGMAVRIPDVDVTSVNSCVAPEKIDELKQIFSHYGHAGPAFVRELVAKGLHRDPDRLRERVFGMARSIAGPEGSSARIRAAIPFAITAISGTLAQRFGILPAEADIPDGIRWAWGQFCSSSDALAIDPEQQAVVRIRQYIAERWDVTIKNVNDGQHVNNREAVAWYDHDTIFLPTNRIAEAAGGDLKEQRIATVLADSGYLSLRGGPRRIAVRYIPKIGHVDCYALSRKKFGRTNKDADPSPLRVVTGDE